MGQTGALFGLDARLALAIFGVLAVVTGYVAFGRIEIARQAALVGEIQAFEHAFAQYQKDMGTFYLFTLNKAPDDSDSTPDITALWEQTMVRPGFRPRWSGPYLARENRHSRAYGSWSVFYAQPDRQNYCTAQSGCDIWLTLSKVPAARWLEVNRALDEAGGTFPEAKGEDIRVGRVQSDGATDPRALFFRIEGRMAP